MFAIIGGSGLYSLPDLQLLEKRTPMTDFGAPSAPLLLGRVADVEVMFLARHGEQHFLAPHQINYRANMQALADAGATEVVAVASVGGIREGLDPGMLVIPDQIIDYTWGRASSFFEGGRPVPHADMTEPYAPALRQQILQAAERSGEAVHPNGTYAATQGPRLETAAEIRRLERDGADIVGMTGMPEATLARELHLEYAAIAVVVNHAAGKGDSSKGISMMQMQDTLGTSMGRVCKILRALVAP